jgi:hypothetical protein
MCRNLFKVGTVSGAKINRINRYCPSPNAAYFFSRRSNTRPEPRHRSDPGLNRGFEFRELQGCSFS